MPPWTTVAITSGTVVVVLVAYLAWAVRSNRRAGASGLARKVRLSCPKCGESFDYALVPGASATSVRLGRSRYMSCLLCGHWSVIRVADAPVAWEASTEGSRGMPPAR